MDVATGPRQNFKIYTRRFIAHSYYGIARLIRATMGLDSKCVTSIMTYPVITDISNLSDIVNRLKWYLPKTNISNLKIFIPVDKKLLNITLDSLTPPSFQENYLSSENNIHLMEETQSEINDVNPDAVLLWDSRRMYSKYILSHLPRVFIVDPSYYHSFEALNYSRLFNLTTSPELKTKLAEQSKDNFCRLLREVDGCHRGYVFATGPSLATAYDFDYSGGFRIICNTIVKNQDLLEHIKPQLLVFIDEANFFSVSRFSAEFHKMVLKTVNQFHCYVMVPDHLVALLLAHFPELKDRIIGISAPGLREMSVREIIKMLIVKPWKFLSFVPELDKIPGKNEWFNFPQPDKMYVMRSTSVFTSHVLPVASTVCDEIYIIGADGRKPGEKYYHSYDKSSQFGELMQTLFDTHPAIFRDSIYTDYYRKHCDFIGRIIRYGEERGKKYYSLTPSYIPALAKRQAGFGLGPPKFRDPSRMKQNGVNSQC